MTGCDKLSTSITYLLCCKLHVHIITSKTVNYLEGHKILNDCQHRFSAREVVRLRKCLYIILKLAASYDKNIQIDMIILDFSNALDCLPQQRQLKSGSLWNKRHYTPEDKILSKLKNTAGASGGSIIEEGAGCQCSAPGILHGPYVVLIFISSYHKNTLLR